MADAVLYTCGLGYHKAYLNDEETDDAELDPAHSNYAHVCYYRVTPGVGEIVTEGLNRLEIKVAPRLAQERHGVHVLHAG